jgi:hypothetical protein
MDSPAFFQQKFSTKQAFGDSTLPVRDNRHGQTYRPDSEPFCAEIGGIEV